MAHNKKLGAKHHEVIGQQSFLGASVINYTLNLGFGNQPSRLTLNLIEDSEHTLTPEGKTRYYNAVHEGYHPWKTTVLPFNLDVFEHDDNLGGQPINDPAGGDKPPYKGGRLGKKVLEKIDGPNPDTEGDCAGAEADNKTDCEAATPAGVWTSAQQFAYKYGDKFFGVGAAKDSSGNDIKKTMLGGPVWFNWYRYDKVDAEDPSCGGGTDCGKEGDILLKDFSAKHPWYFNGMLSSIEVTNSSSAGRITSVTVEDPRSVLAGTHVILGKFQGRTMNADGSLGTISHPYPERLYKHGFMGYYNVLNVYGFLEDVYGFGAVDKNESGIIWWDESGKNSASERLVTEPVKDSAGNDIGTLDEYYQAPGTNVIDVLQWMLMGSADAVHGEKEYVGWPKVREPGTVFFKVYRYHGPSTDEESDPDKQRPTDPAGERVGQERYGGLLYYTRNPLIKDPALIAPEQDYLYGPKNKDSATGYGTWPSQVNRFKVDLSELKDLHVDVHESGLLDSDFRIQADDMSLLDLIQNICDYASADFFVELLPDIAPWPRGQKEFACRNPGGFRLTHHPVTGDPISTAQECVDGMQQAQGNVGAWAEEVITPQNGEGVTGVIKIRVVHRVKPPRPNLLGAMIEDSKFDPDHIDDGEAPPFNPVNSKHFKKWRGRLQSSKIGYEFADLPTGKMLMGAPRTRMVGVDNLGEDILRTEFGDCKDENDEKVDLTTTANTDRKAACETLGKCYDKAHADYVADGSCADQAGVAAGPPIAVYPASGTGVPGEEIDNEIDCNDTANLPSDGQWCPYIFEAGRQLTDFDGVEGPTSRSDSKEGFFDTTNQMLEDKFGRDILGNQKLYEKRDYRNDFWANAIKDQPSLMRISGPNGVDDYRGSGLEGWGTNGTADDQPSTTTLGEDPNDPATKEKLSDQPLFGDGGADPVSNVGDHLGGDGYADLLPAWGFHDRPDYCKLITTDPPGSHDDSARVCEAIMGCSWTWKNADDHSKGGKCADTIPVKKTGVPKKGFFWDDEPQKDFNPPNRDFGYPKAERSTKDDEWTKYHPPAGLMSMYEWVEPNCAANIYEFPACEAVNTFKGQGYGSKKFPNYTRPRLKTGAFCLECEEENFVCHDTAGDTEALSTGDTSDANNPCPAAGEKLAKQKDCLNPLCYADPSSSTPITNTEWIGGGCKKWKNVDPSVEEIKDIDDCLCDKEEEFEKGIVPQPSPVGPVVPTPPSCSGGNEKFTAIEKYDEEGFDDLQGISRRAGGGNSGIQLPDSAIIEIDMSKVYKETGSSGFEVPLYKHGEDLPGFSHLKHTYKATVLELRAAAMQKSAWEDYLSQWGKKLQADMKWDNTASIGWFDTMFEGSMGSSTAKAGTDGNAVTALGKMRLKAPLLTTQVGNETISIEIQGPDKSDTSYQSILDGMADQYHTKNAVLDSEEITKDMNTIFNKIQDIATNWYGKAYLMPLPYDPEDISKHVRVTAESNKGAELEAPKLDLDWDIAPSAFVELEFDKLQDGHKLKYPLSNNFVSDEGKMSGFFVYPQEYKGVEPTDSQSTTPKGKPSALSVNVNRIDDTERYFTLKDINAPIGSTKRGKVFVKVEVDPITYWLWDNEEVVINYVRENHSKPGFKIRDAFDPNENGSCEGEAGADPDDPTKAPSTSKGGCDNVEVNGVCDDTNFDDQQECEQAGNTWGGGAGTWTANGTVQLRPYALLRASEPVEHDEGLTDREKAMSGKRAVQFVFDSLFDWDVISERSDAFSGVAVNVLRGGVVPARFKPFGAAVPQVSNRHVWGPWSLGIDFGKVEVQKDNTFEPSNFGSIDKMNKAAIAKIKAELVSQQITESGFVELTGGPEYFAGNPIGDDEDFSQYLTNIGATGSIAPYITDIAVDTNPSAGVTTKYTMRTWTPRLGKLEDWKLKQGVKQTRDLHKQDMENNDRVYKEARVSQQVLLDVTKAALNTAIIPRII